MRPSRKRVSTFKLDDGAIDKVNAEIARLNNLAYQLGLTTMVRVREERVGSAAPGALDESTLTEVRLQEGPTLARGR